MSARDAYLAYQAEIGTEEVVLAQPWVRPAAVASANARSIPETGSDPRAASLRVRENSPDFFSSIAEALKAPAPRAAPRPVPVPAAPAAAPTLPEFSDLSAYWAFLETELPRWFPGAPPPIVRAEGHPGPALAVVELFPSGDRVFAGEAGALLDRMLKAIELDRDRLYLTSLMKTPPPGKQWLRKDVARMLPCLFRELRLAGCGLVLLLGEACAQTVLRTGESLDALSEQAVEAEGLSFAASWHPSDLLRDEELKRKAWKDLKWIRGRLPTRGS